MTMAMPPLPSVTQYVLTLTCWVEISLDLNLYHLAMVVFLALPGTICMQLIPNHKMAIWAVINLICQMILNVV